MASAPDLRIDGHEHDLVPIGPMAVAPAGSIHREWQVLEPDGKSRGTVRLPTNVVLHLADSEHAWGIETDSLGVRSVVRHRIERGDRQVR